QTATPAEIQRRRLFPEPNRYCRPVDLCHRESSRDSPPGVNPVSRTEESYLRSKSIPCREHLFWLDSRQPVLIEANPSSCRQSLREASPPSIPSKDSPLFPVFPASGPTVPRAERRRRDTGARL